MSSKIKFVVAASVHAEGELSIQGMEEININLKSATVVPVIVIIGDTDLTSNETHRIKMIALHQLMLQAASKCEPQNTEITQHPILPEGEVN